ncbi:MAG: aryl-sulfate sulfotransferase [bacterium]
MKERNFINIYLTCFILFLTQNLVHSQMNTWSVTTLTEPSAGYIKFDNNGNENFYLFDNYGNKIYIDTSSELYNSNYCQMLSNGFWSIYKDSKYRIYNQDMQLVDSINYTGEFTPDVHDMNVLPNGHYILIGIEQRLMDMSEIVEGGEKDATIIGAHLIEVDKDGTVYWSWNSFDHFNILDVTDEVDLTNMIIPFTHANSITIDLDGNIILSCRNLDEITKIDKITGDIIWRLGGSSCKNNEFIFVNDTISGFYGFSHQHSVNVLPNGNILLYDNGTMKPEQYSRAVEYELDENNMTATKVWEYSGITKHYYSSKGSVQRLENGDTFINWGEDKITEIGRDGNIVFEMRSSLYYPVYRAFRYVTKMNAVGIEMKSPGIYSYLKDTNETNIVIVVKNLTGTSYSMVEKHYYSPLEASYREYSFSEILPYRWVLSKRGISNMSAEIRIKLYNLNYIGDKNKLTIYGRVSENAGAFETIQTSYNSESDELVGNFTNLGEFVIGSNVLAKPILTSPVDGAKVPANNGSLQWEKTTGSTKYKLQISKVSDFSESVKDTIIEMNNNYNYNKLDNKTNYYWRVAAMNHKDTSDWSDSSSFITELGPPILESPEDKIEGLDTNLTVTWDFISDSCSFWIQVSDTDDFSNLIYENKNITGTEVSFTVDEYYKIYYWHVCSIESQDTSQWSETRSFMTMMSGPLVIYPEKNQINIPVSGTFIWDSVKGASSYVVQLSDDSTFNELLIDEDEVMETEYEYSNLQNFKDYFLRIKAKNGKDSSNWCENINFKTKLLEPTLFLPKNGADEIELNPLEFHWYEMQYAEFYKIQASFDDSLGNIIYEKDSIYNSFVDYWDFPFNRKIYWRVKSFNGLSESNWSEIWSFTTFSNIYLYTPKLQTPLNHSDENENSGHLNWSDIQYAEIYHLQLSNIDTFENCIINDSNITESNYNYTMLDYDSTYFWRVKAKNTEKESKWSEIFDFTVKSGNYISDFDINDCIKLYPQPAGDYLFIKLNIDKSKEFAISISDALGRSFYREETINLLKDNLLYIDASQFPDGIYFIRITSGTLYTNRKMIIIHD